MVLCMQFEMQVPKPNNLYEELLLWIKSQLCSHRKRDPTCCISMGFDVIHFNGLARRGVLDKKPQQNVYTLTKLGDLLGSRWYIRGINTVEDLLCGAKDGKVSVEVLPRQSRLPTATLKQYTYGICYLVCAW